MCAAEMQGDGLPVLRSKVPATKWVKHRAIEEEGLSSGVRKVFALVTSADGGEKKGIKRFLALAKA